MKKWTTYHLLAEREVERENGDYEMIQPVVKRVHVRDGINSFIQQEKQVAESLPEFRKRFPNQPVEGAPVHEHMKDLIRGLSDEDLARAGLKRIGDERNADDLDLDLFSGKTALNAAIKAGLTREQFLFHLPEGGGGAGATYNSEDVRTVKKLVAEAESADEE